MNVAGIFAQAAFFKEMDVTCWCVYFSRKPWVISCRTIRASNAQPVEHRRHA